MHMTTWERSGFQAHLCNAEGSEMSYDECRHFLIDDSKLLVFNKEDKNKRFATVLNNHLEDPDSPWNEA